MNNPESRPRPRHGRTVVTLALALVLYEGVSAAFGIRYNVFRDPFDLGRFLIDVAIWAGAAALSVLILRLIGGRTA
jgi:hypothetical protein